MANNNTKVLKNMLREARKAGEDTLDIMVTRNQNKIGIHIPIARVKGDGVNSVNKQRNSCQRIYLNTGTTGTSSLTAHEPFLRNEPMRFPNHDYMEYRRPGAPA